MFTGSNEQASKKDYQTGSSKGMSLSNVTFLIIFCDSFAMEQDPECTAERELLEAASTIATFSITAPPDEEQSQPKAEVSCELSKENPEKDKGSKDQGRYHSFILFFT